MARPHIAIRAMPVRARWLPLALALLWSTAASADDSGFSALSEITADNVAQLKLAFSVELPAAVGYAATPQIAGQTLFVLSPFPHTVNAIALQADAAGAVKWRYSPPSQSAAAGRRTGEPGRFGPTLANGSVYLNTLDGHTIALDADSGQVKWDRKTADLGGGETLVGAPLAVGDAVVIGNAGDDFGARGWIKSLNRGSGAERWRKYVTGPDADVGIGASFQPFYQTDKGADLGVASWPPGGWQQGGGSVSGRLSYDPALNLIFHGTGHPAPGNPGQRPGANKWTAGLFAREPDTGAARWFTQLNPHDLYSFGATNANILADRDWNGAKRQLLIQANGNGFVYVLDRGTGEILAAAPFAPVNTMRRVDTGTATPQRFEAKLVKAGKTVRDICPAPPGAAIGAPAYSETSGLLFIAASFLCMDAEAQPVSFIRDTPYTGLRRRLKPMPNQPSGALIAWDLAKAKAAWTVPERFPLLGGVLTTAANLVFYGTLDGRLRALDSRNGHVLWEYDTKSQIAGQPVSYTGPDDRQYLAVVAGAGGGAGRAAENEIDTRDLTAANGFANALPDLPHPAEAAGRLYVFRLP